MVGGKYETHFFLLIVFFIFKSLYSAWCPLRVYNNIGFMFQRVIRFIHSAQDGEMAFQDVIHAVEIVLDIVSSKMPSLYSINIDFTNMSCKALFLYIKSMYDENITHVSASYVENILNCYKSEL